MICQNCGEKEATVSYGKLYFFCSKCNDEYLEEVAKDYGYLKNDSQISNQTKNELKDQEKK